MCTTTTTAEVNETAQTSQQPEDFMNHLYAYITAVVTECSTYVSNFDTNILVLKETDMENILNIISEQTNHAVEAANAVVGVSTTSKE